MVDTTSDSDGEELEVDELLGCGEEDSLEVRENDSEEGTGKDQPDGQTQPAGRVLRSRTTAGPLRQNLKKPTPRRSIQKVSGKNQPDGKTRPEGRVLRSRTIAGHLRQNRKNPPPRRTTQKASGNDQPNGKTQPEGRILRSHAIAEPMRVNLKNWVPSRFVKKSKAGISSRITLRYPEWPFVLPPGKFVEVGELSSRPVHQVDW